MSDRVVPEAAASPSAAASTPPSGIARWLAAETLRPVMSTLGLLAIVAGVRWFLLLRVSWTDESEAFGELGEFHVWVLLLSTTVALWVAIAVMLMRAVLDIFDKKNRPAIGWTALGYAVIAGAVVALLQSMGGGPDVPLYASRVKLPLLVALILALAWPAVLGLWWSQARLGRLDHDLPMAPPVATVEASKAAAEQASAPAGQPERRALRTAELLGLRRLILRVLAAVSVGISAGVLSAGALRNALLAHTPTTDFPAEAVLLYGAFFSTIFALVFVPAFLEWRAVAGRLVDDAFPIPPDGIPTKEWHEGRASISSMLGLDASPLQALGPLLGVLGPVLASLLALFVPELGP